MEISQINQRIAVLNADSKRINNDRAVSIGKKETLQKQMNDALAAYKAKYGVDLTETNLQAEIDRVSAEKLKEVEKIEAVLNLIKLGQYDEANALVNGTPAKTEEPVAPVQETPVTSGVVEQPQAPVMQESIPTPPVMQESIPTPPDLGIPTPPNLGIPTPPVQESIPTPPDLGIPEPPTLGTPVATPPVQESIPTPPSLGTPAESIPTPPILGSPMESIPTPPSEPSLGVPPVAPTSTPSGQPIASFNAILGGSPFKPQGEV